MHRIKSNKYPVLFLIFFLSLTTALYFLLGAVPEKTKPPSAATGLPTGSLQDWEKDKLLFKIFNPSKPEDCKKEFNLLWAWSKKGNLEARRGIIELMVTLHGPYMNFPINSDDVITRKRHVTILAVHSVSRELDNSYDGFFLDVKGLGPKSKFGECIQKNRSEKCTQIAVDENIVPSFESFSKEIDLFIGDGYSATCHAYYE